MTTTMTRTNTMTNGQGGDAGGGGGNHLTLYDKVGDPIAAAEKLGLSLFKSGLFGLTTPDQGTVLAMACLCDRMNPMEIGRTYHIFNGRLSMKSEAMLAKFVERGGKYEILSRDSDEAAVKMTPPGGSATTFRFAWEEAKSEDYVYKGDGKTLKDNWKTPRRRMQMLWARVVSDGVRAVMPGVVVGTYTPEEVEDMPEMAVPATATATAAAKEDRTAKRREELKAMEKAEAGTVATTAATATAGSDDVIDVEPEAVAAPATPASPAVQPDPSDVPFAETAPAPASPSPPCSREQLVRLASLGDECGIPRDELKAELCKAASVAEPKEMTAEQAAKLIERFEGVLEKKRSS